MRNLLSEWKSIASRRSFLRRSLTAGTATIGGALVAGGMAASAKSHEGKGPKNGKLGRGDAAILRFLCAAEIIETDFWVQYNELGGVQDSEVPGGSGNPIYTAKLAVLDEDMAQYIHDNTEDEFTHQNFLNAYLSSKGADTVNFDQFRTLPGSTADGIQRKVAAYKSHAAHVGHQLVDTVPKQHE